MQHLNNWVPLGALLSDFIEKYSPDENGQLFASPQKAQVLFAHLFDVFASR